jgi:hypothetical protein
LSRDFVGLSVRDDQRVAMRLVYLMVSQLMRWMLLIAPESAAKDVELFNGRSSTTTASKGQYRYFFCLGRHQRQTTCQQPYLDVDAAEAAVERERFWRTVRLPADIKQTIQDGLRIELDTQHDRAQPEIRRARERVEQLSQERRRLARGVVTGSIPDDLDLAPAIWSQGAHQVHGPSRC